MVTHQVNTERVIMVGTFFLVFVLGVWTDRKLRRLLRQPGSTTLITPAQILPGSGGYRITWYLFTNRFSSENSKQEVIRAAHWALLARVLGYLWAFTFLFMMFWRQ